MSPLRGYGDRMSPLLFSSLRGCSDRTPAIHLHEAPSSGNGGTATAGTISAASFSCLIILLILYAYKNLIAYPARTRINPLTN